MKKYLALLGVCAMSMTGAFAKELVVSCAVNGVSIHERLTDKENRYQLTLPGKDVSFYILSYTAQETGQNGEATGKTVRFTRYLPVGSCLLSESN